jgi:hypothetical protein
VIAFVQAVEALHGLCYCVFLSQVSCSYLDTLLKPAAWIFPLGFPSGVESSLSFLCWVGTLSCDREHKHWIGPGSRIEEFVYTPHKRWRNGQHVYLISSSVPLIPPHRIFPGYCEFGGSDLRYVSLDRYSSSQIGDSQI